MQRIFRTRTFSRWMRRAGVGDPQLRLAIQEMRAGLIDASLGAGLFKKRVAIAGRGKRGGARTIVATRRGHHWFFLYGFEKNERADLDHIELLALRRLAATMLSLEDGPIERLLATGELTEIETNESSQEPNSE
ncbi:MAG: type II toxin-antitoxin system RelE/ParE family toxin [Xanthomonadales bacterium]|nr:type II toxin-antitoxin system RelE/ParE family toxin [Xanthomonadales bacterium]